MQTTETKGLDAAARRAHRCPACGAAPGAPCRGSRVPSPATLGGGWGGPPSLRREHTARVELARRPPVPVAVVATEKRDETLAIPANLCDLGRAAAEAVLAGVDAECVAKFNRLATTGGCRAFYTPEEWRAKGWEVANNAVLVCVHDGGDMGRWVRAPGTAAREVFAALERLGLRFECADYCVTTIHR